MRIVLHLIGPQPDLLEQLCDPFPLCVARGDAMNDERFAHDIAGGHARIERRKRVLEHDLHRTPVRAQVRFAEMGDIEPVQANAAPGRLDETKDAARHRRLAAAGFADQPERLSDANGKAHAVHGMHGADFAAKDAASHRIMLFQVRYFEQRSRLRHDDPAISAARQHAAR